jgi:hypothetical protein
MKTLTWPMRTVASIADVDPRILSQWFATGMLKYRRDDKHHMGTGTRSGLSRPRVIEATIVRLLSRYGVPASRAGRASFEFTINGNHGRPAGELFPMGKTVLVIRQHDAVVANVDPDARVSDLSNNGIALIVDLNKVVSDVDAALNSHSNERLK